MTSYTSYSTIKFIDDLTKNLQEGLQMDVLIMDFAKAFDSQPQDTPVWHPG